ncbi:MAG: NUDIX domain-containing protein [Cyanobacteria bacterium P01_F01_bin.53]
MKPQRTRVSAYGLVMNEQRILLCRVSKALPRWEGQWTLPGGGIDFGEHPQDAMVREVNEETGLIVAPTNIATINSLYDDSGKTDFHGIRILYHTQLLGGELCYELEGTTDKCQWWTQQELANLQLVDISQLAVKLLFGETVLS